MWGIFIALISGMVMSLQGVFNTELTKQTNLWVAAGWAQITAFAVCAAVWMASGREPVSGLWKVDQRYMLLTGVLGAVITITVVKSMESLGPAKATMLILIAQMTVSYVIELFGIFGVDRQPFSWRKLLGALIAAGGIVLFQWE